jgi:hypothetical protein
VNAGAMREALLSVATRPRKEMRAAVRAHFDSELSFEAVGRKLVAAYGGSLRLKAARQARPRLSCV